MADLSVVESVPFSAGRVSAPPASDAGDMRALVDRKADQYGVPRDLAHTVVQLESGYNPRADSGKARGLMQLSPATASDYGVKNVFDPEQNADGGMRLLSDLTTLYQGNTRNILAAYNAGQGAVDKYGGVPPFKETQNYVAKGMRSLPETIGAPGAAQQTSPAMLAAAAPVSDAQDLFRRIAGGEQIEITPQVLAQIISGAGKQPAAPAAPAPAPPKLSVVESRPLPPAPTAEASPIAKAAGSFWEGLGGPELINRLKTAVKNGDFSVLGPDAIANDMLAALPEESQRIALEAARASATSDPWSTAYHLAGMIPMFGAPVQQFIDDISRGAYAEATGHGGAIATQVLGPKIAEGVAPRVGPTLRTAATVAREAVPVVKGAATGAYEAATETVPFRRFGIDVNLPKPVVTGAAGGTAASAMGLPRVPGAVIGAIAPIVRGAVRGAQEALAERTALADAGAAGVPGVAPEVPIPIPPERQLAAPPIVTPAPADTSGVTAVPAQYPEVQPGFTPPTATPSTTTTPWRGPGGEPMTPGQAYAMSQGLDWNTLRPVDRQLMEQIGQARANVAAQPAPAPAPPLTTSDLSRSLYGNRPLSDAEAANVQALHQQVSPEVPASPVMPAVPATVPAAGPPAAPIATEAPPAAPAIPPAPEALPAVAGRPQSAEIARQLEDMTRVDRFTGVLRAIDPNITPADLDKFGPHDWELMRQRVGGSLPTAEQMQEIRANLAVSSAPIPPEVARMTPAEAEAAVAPVRRARTQPTPPAAPPAESVVLRPGQTPAEALAEAFPELVRKPPPEGPAPPTASDVRVEAFAKAFAGSDIPTADLAALEDSPEDLQRVEQVGRALGIPGRPAPGEIARIVDRVRQIRGERPVTPAEAEAAFQRAKAAGQATIPPDAIQQTQARGGPAVPGTPGEVQAPTPAVDRPAPVAGTVYPGQSGAGTTIRIPGESNTYPAHYAVRELADVQASHNPHNFEPNPRYTLRNDRNYSDLNNQQRIVLDSLPGRFVPEYLITDSPDAVNGPPVTDPSGNVLGGNSRAMKLARVYQNNPADAAGYRALLEQRAAHYGIDPAAVRGMKQPILVRELKESAEPQRLITDLNKSGTASYTAAERAMADAGRLSADAAEYLAGAIEAEGSDATLNDVLSGKRGPHIVQKLVDDGVFTVAEEPALIDRRTGAVTAAAKERISKMLLGQLFADTKQLVRTPAELRNKLERIVAPVLQSGQEAGFDLMPHVRQAIDLLEYARSHGIANISDVLKQESFGGEAPTFSAEAVHLAEFLRDTKPTALAQAFRRYVADITPTFFGESTPAEAFRDAFGAK